MLELDLEMNGKMRERDLKKYLDHLEGNNESALENSVMGDH